MSDSLVGSRLAHFKLTALLGRGGMGEVYRATDTRLGREVAVKVLPRELARREELRSRLEREARAVSRLSHPHICTLYDLGVDGETTFLVMELVEGRTLDARLREGPLPVDEALRLAIQIASALSAAHERNLVHRDLKPGNVMLTSEGVKLLDFGLAKILGEDPGEAGLADTLTLAGPLTSEGAVLGTPQYMAPEQVAGQPADPRTDLFAFGALLYEMLSGARAFSGESRRELAAAILRDDPKPLGERIPGLPRSLERLVRKCLAKDPGARWRCAADLADELRWIASERAEKIPEPRPGRRGSLLTAASVALIAVAIGLTAGWLLARRGTPGTPATPQARPTRFTLHLPESAPFLPVRRSALAVSPDGRQIVYTGGDLSDKRLYLRSLDRDAVHAIDGTEGGESPFFSPDGRRLGFFTRYALRYVAPTGGPAQEVGIAPPATRGAVWLASGDIVAAPTKAASLFRVPVREKGPVQPLTKLDPALGGGQSWPSLFDGQRKVLVTVAGPKAASYDDAKIVAIDLATGRQSVVVEGGSQGRYLPGGHLVFAREGSLFAAPFDVKTMRLTGSPVAVLDHVLSDPVSGTAHAAISPAGTLVYARGGAVNSNESTLVWLDRSGKEEAIPAEPRAILTPRISPDGGRVVFSVEAVSDDLWVYDLGRGASRRLTFGGRNIAPIWTPDGSGVTYASVRHGSYPAVYSLAADGSGRETKVTSSEGAAIFPGSWSPDGKLLALSRFGGPTGWDVYLDTPGEPPRPLVAGRFNEASPAISPDGAWLAYCSDESGGWEVYVTSFPSPGERIQVSAAESTQPVWAPHGLELLYRSGDRLMSVRLKTGPHLGAYPPEEVIHRLPVSGDGSVIGTPFFDVTPDGRRFLVVRRHPLPRFDRLEVVLDWLAELKRRVPAPE